MNNVGTQQHLTDDQFAEAMLGNSLPADAQAHVSVCEACQAELNDFSVAVHDFKSASRTWSEARSEQMAPVRPGRGGSGVRESASLFPAYAWAAAGLVAIGVTVPLVEHARQQQQPAPAVAQNDESMDSPEQIARDNELLAEVHFELTRADLPVPAPAVARGKVRTRP